MRQRTGKGPGAGQEKQRPGERNEACGRQGPVERERAPLKPFGREIDPSPGFLSVYPHL